MLIADPIAYPIFCTRCGETIRNDKECNVNHGFEYWCNTCEVSYKNWYNPPKGQLVRLVKIIAGSSPTYAEIDYAEFRKKLDENEGFIQQVQYSSNTHTYSIAIFFMVRESKVSDVMK